MEPTDDPEDELAAYAAHLRRGAMVSVCLLFGIATAFFVIGIAAGGKLLVLIFFGLVFAGLASYGVYLIVKDPPLLR